MNAEKCVRFIGFFTGRRAFPGRAGRAKDLGAKTAGKIGCGGGFLSFGASWAASFVQFPFAGFARRTGTKKHPYDKIIRMLRCLVTSDGPGDLFSAWGSDHLAAISALYFSSSEGEQ